MADLLVSFSGLESDQLDFGGLDYHRLRIFGEGHWLERHQCKIRHEFPEVKRISTEELTAWIDNSQRASPLLLDVRTQAEFDISHLRNARRVEPDAVIATINLPKDRTIVTYCSVGYRSAVFARQLMRAGYTNVTNVEGSIFKWANEDRPVYRGALRVSEVHPYNGTWGKLLDPTHRAKIRAAKSVKARCRSCMAKVHSSALSVQSAAGRRNEHGIRLADCGCFGILFPHPLSWLMAFEDLIFAALSLLLYFLAHPRIALARPLSMFS